MKNDIVLLFVFLLLILGLGSFFVFAPKASEITYKPVDVGGGSIIVENQEQYDSVILDAELAAPGWITIHESLSGAPAAVIGTSKYLEVGLHQNLSILLTESMFPGYKYITLLHVDNGDGVFIGEEDYPVKVNEEVVRPDFIAIGPEGNERIVDIPGTDQTLILDPEE
jgi:hypothetical protein